MYNVLGFRDPLESPRYRYSKYIDINLLSTKANGLAFDAMARHPLSPNRGGDCSLHITLSVNLQDRASIAARWFVVSHEMFHLYQYGYTLFKRAWVNEPLAKWAEYALRKRDMYPLEAPPEALPATTCEIDSLIANPVSREANRFWSRLVQLMDSSDAKIHLPPTLMQEEYVGGEKVFKDDTLRGVGFIAAVFQTLDAEDDAISHLNNWSAYAWHEKDQISRHHDGRILAAIGRVITRAGVTNPEVEAFLHAIKEFGKTNDCSLHNVGSR
ncbi:hypothetical protein C5748_22695 [Phyllobacterium phragmitis]|uniref:Uncharacterized protein n=1 Tax=Phyllobacterium phragmitis TaxID=2670329 RepID=A0A2S9IL02_9HYPH|nr:hypothetical protein C5748_22695 [Phyllobacterium phragmitis]